MTVGETIALIVTLFLALYGCAQLIRRLCLWVVRCPGCVCCWRLAVPRQGTALAPLFRCLQAQAVWEEPEGCRRTLVLLPEMTPQQRQALEPLLREAPAVTPVTAAELAALLAAENQED